jgi:hypothetical protein
VLKGNVTDKSIKTHTKCANLNVHRCKIKKNINTKNAEKKHYELITLASDDTNMNVPDGKRYDEETSIGITGGKSAKKTRKSRKNNGKTQKSRR